jgi:hypothetical protein
VADYIAKARPPREAARRREPSGRAHRGPRRAGTFSGTSATAAVESPSATARLPSSRRCSSAAEQGSHKPRVGGSIPPTATNLTPCSLRQSVPTQHRTAGWAIDADTSEEDADGGLALLCFTRSSTVRTLVRLAISSAGRLSKSVIGRSVNSRNRRSRSVRSRSSAAIAARTLGRSSAPAASAVTSRPIFPLCLAQLCR